MPVNVSTHLFDSLVRPILAYNCEIWNRDVYKPYYNATERAKKNNFKDRPFNLQGWGYVFLFCSEFFFRTTRELEYLFLLSCKARIFFPECNIRLYDKHSESDYFFSLHQNQNFFFSNIGYQNIYLEKKNIPPPSFKLNGRSLNADQMHFIEKTPYDKIYNKLCKFIVGIKLMFKQFFSQI